MKPKISIIMAAFNEEKLLPNALKALQNQDYPKNRYEVIVVDNGSTDRTAEIAKEFGATVMKYTERHGCGAVRQYGAMHSDGAIIAITDADSEAAPNWLSEIERLLEKKDIVAVAGKAYPRRKNPFISFVFFFYDIFCSINMFFHKPVIWGFNLAIKREAFEKIGGFNIMMETSDDWDLAMRLQDRFGNKSIMYTPLLKVYTSTRKQENLKALLRYSYDGLRSYIAIMLLQRKRSLKIFNVR